MTESNNKQAKGTRGGIWSFRLAATGLVFIAVGLVGARGGVSPLVAMLLITLGSLIIIIGGLFGAVSLLRSRGTAGETPALLAWIALLLGIGAVMNAANMMGSGGAPIHDISTDTADPPDFVAVAKLRGPEDNPAEYAGPESASIQAEAYPDIETLEFLMPADEVFPVALAAAENMGWEIVASEATQGRIEATATTPFVGFKDDVVIRLREVESGTLVDIRSKSRFGKGDMGVNAERVRRYREELLGLANQRT